MTDVEIKFMEMVPAQLREIAKQLTILNKNMAQKTEHKEEPTETKPLIKNPTQYADYEKLSIELYHKNGEFGAYLSDNKGGSGITVKGLTPEQVTLNLAQYIEDYFYNN